MTDPRLHGFDCRSLRAHLTCASLILISLVSAFSLRAVDCVPLPSGVIGWWPGDGNGKDIYGTNNGTLLGGVTANAAAIVGSGFRMDGTNGYIQVPNAPALN